MEPYTNTYFVVTVMKGRNSIFKL